MDPVFEKAVREISLVASSVPEGEGRGELFDRLLKILDICIETIRKATENKKKELEEERARLRTMIGKTFREVPERKLKVM